MPADNYKIASNIKQEDRVVRQSQIDPNIPKHLFR